MIFFLIGAVSAADDLNATTEVSTDEDNSEEVPILGEGTDDALNQENDVDASQNESENPEMPLADSGDDPVLNVSEDNPVINEDENEKAAPTVGTQLTCDEINVLKGKYFHVTLLDENGKALSKKTVTFTVNKVKYNATTNSKGIAKITINLKVGTYTIKYSFKEAGYKASSGSTKIFVIPTIASKVIAKDFETYIGFNNKYNVRVMVGNTPLASRSVTIKFNGKTYNQKTNEKGYAFLNITAKKGTYTLKCSYAGEKNIKASSAQAKIKIYQGMPVKIEKANNEVYKEKTPTPFKIKLVDKRGKVLANTKVSFIIFGKTYVKTTDKNGIATLTINSKAGSHNLKVLFKKTYRFNKAEKSFKVNVQAARGNGVWLFGSDMKSVSLNQMQRDHVRHIFLNYYAIQAHGKAAVEKFAQDAKSRGITVHIWMQVFYGENGWQSPVYGNGNYNYNLINSKINEAKYYAKLKGIGGVHFDYIRFPGTAFNHKNGVNAINYFTKEASYAIHKINPNCIVSAAIMPEPDSNKHYYGQDVPTLSKYLDVLVPMVYKGNYNAGTSWIQKITNIFVKQSSKAQVWTGLQSYGSDSNVVKLPAGELMKDAKAARAGGAAGVIIFRWGLYNYFDFDKV